MAGKYDMLDNDFLDDDEKEGKQPSFGEDKEFKPEGYEREDKKPEDHGMDVEIEVKSDTPPEDEGKWSATDRPTEEVTETEAEKYSKKVQARIDRETAKTHAERRAKEERERQLNEAAGLMRRLIDENNQLKGLIENGEKVFMNEHTSRLESQMTAAKAALREATEAGDTNGQIAAQENMAKLAAQRAQADAYRAQPLTRLDERQVLGQIVRNEQPEQVAPTKQAQDWQAKNKWFGRDDVMTSHAMAYHNRLARDEGITEQDGDLYWNKINGEMRKRFPEKFQDDQGRPRRTDTVVAPAARSSGGAPRRTVTLTETQVRLARRLGLTPQQYAEQMVAEQQAGTKEWTHGRQT